MLGKIENDGAMNKADDRLIKDFIRVVESNGGYFLEVGVVGWDGPHRPYIIWKVFRKWRHAPSAQRLAAAQQKALQESRFFKICFTCHERNNVGHMFDSEICQTCAEHDLGIVY